MLLSFEERNGLEKVRVLQTDELDHITRKALYQTFITANDFSLWNVKYSYGSYNNESVYCKLRNMYKWLQNSRDLISELNCQYENDRPVGCDMIADINRIMRKSKWSKVYSFIESIIQYLSAAAENTSNAEYKTLFKKSLSTNVEAFNDTLESYNCGYRIIQSHVVPITNNTEMTAIDEALSNHEQYITDHLNKAIDLLKSSEYKKSIHESISATEAFARQYKVSNGNRFDFRKTIKNLDIHAALRDALVKLYGWSSDEDGIRHSNKASGYNNSVGMDEAKLTLVVCSSLINYIKNKIK